MIHSLLLDSTTNTVTLTSLLGVYIALGGTITAAGIAAWASVSASRRTATTAEKVAALSAQVAADSSALAARTSKELRDKDYKNDYYKRIIDKRIKAIEQVETLIIMFRSYATTDDGKSFNLYFVENLHTKNYSEIVDAIIGSALWLDWDTTNAVKKLMYELNPIIKEAKKCKNEDEVIDLVYTKHDIIKKRRNRVISCLGKDMHTLYDIDAFLHSRFDINDMAPDIDDNIPDSDD